MYLLGGVAKSSDVLRDVCPVVVVVSYDPLHLVEPVVEHIVLVARLCHAHIKVVKNAVQLLSHRGRIIQSTPGGRPNSMITWSSSSTGLT